MSEQDSNRNRWHPEQLPEDTAQLPAESPAESPAATAAAPRTRRRPAWLTSGRLVLAAAAVALLLVAGTGGFALGRVTADDHAPSFTDRDGDGRGLLGDRGGDDDDQRYVPQPQDPTTGSETSFPGGQA